MIFGCLDLYFGSRTYILGLGLIFWLYGLIFCFLDSYFDCLDLYFGFWTYIWVSGLLIWVSELILRVSGSGRVGRVGSAGSAGSGGRPGRVSSTFGGKSILGICVRKKYILTILLNSELGVFLQKRRAPTNAAFWRAACAEISHMRLIQGRKLKLIIWVVSQFNFWKGSLLYES